MGKRRKTAKTGDRALYNKQAAPGKVSMRDVDDPMYNEVDRFHKDRDDEYLRLDAGDRSTKDNDDDEIIHQDAIMDLGIGGEDSSFDDDVVGDDSFDGSEDKEEVDSETDEEEEVSLSSDSDNDHMDYKLGDPRNWGKKKSSYYHGDTADLEIGQDEEDAFLEEEAAKEVQAARLKEMTEDDFVLSDEDEPFSKKEGSTVDRNESHVATARDLSRLSSKDRRKLLNKQHPELLPIVSYFTDVIKDLKDKTMVATRALMDGDDDTAKAVGATHAGRQYLLTKALLQSSMALNVAIYLLLGSEQHLDSEPENLGTGEIDQSKIHSHPVMARLQQLNSLAQKLEDRVESKVDNLSEQIGNLVKAAALMNAEQEEQEQSETEHQVHEENEIEDSKESSASSEKEFGSSHDVQISTPVIPHTKPGRKDQRLGRDVLNEAKFGLRPNEVASQSAKRRSGRRSSSDQVASFTDFGDEDMGEGFGKASKALASTINSIEQRSATKSRKRRAAPIAEHLDDHEEDDDELRRGLQMMEEQLGKLESDDEGDDLPRNGGKEDEIDDELEDDDDLAFYNEVSKSSKAKKSRKKSLYQVAPKYPRIENEVEGERAISRTILKNRGLVAHKAKINRNPRVKKREQYRKALIRRKGAVREIRTEEGHKYGGEETGIKSGLSRSRKLGTA